MIQTVTDDEIKLMVTVTKVMFFAITAFCFGLAVAEIVISSLNLKKLKTNTSKTSLIITLLVLSVLSGGIITAGFMVVALCIKDKKPTLENINEIAAERIVSTDDNSSNS